MVESRFTWEDDGLCAQTDPEAFFPEKGGSTREAKKICGECEVRQQCLARAVLGQDRFGILGGLSERERRKLQPARGRNNDIGDDDLEEESAEAA